MPLTPSNRSPEYAEILKANSRARFEAWARLKGYDLSPLYVNGRFQHYLARDTDDAWLGYVAAVEQFRTVALPLLLRMQVAPVPA